MKLRFTRDETSNDVTFVIKGKKSRRLIVSLNNLAMALMAGKEVPCKMVLSKEKITGAGGIYAAAQKKKVTNATKKR